MPAIALQGLCEGTGTTSITAGVAWALCGLGESVLLIDCSPTNMLRLHFNTPYERTEGWAGSLLDQSDWAESAMRYMKGLDFIPFGSLSFEKERDLQVALQETPHFWHHNVNSIQNSRRYNWVLFDLSSTTSTLNHQIQQLCNHRFLILNPNFNCHIRLQQHESLCHNHYIINKFNPVSRLQRDLYRVWSAQLPKLLNLKVHQDEALAASLGKKQPVGECYSHSLAAEELISLASWCLINCSKKKS